MQTEQLKKDLDRTMAENVMSISWETTLSAVVAIRNLFWQAGMTQGVSNVNGAIEPLILIFIIYPLLMRMVKKSS